MKPNARIHLSVAIAIVSIYSLNGADDVGSIGISPGRTRRDLTLIAKPAEPSPALLEVAARVRVSNLEVMQKVTRADIASIDARISKIREECDARIRKLEAERESLLTHEQEIEKSLNAERL